MTRRNEDAVVQQAQSPSFADKSPLDFVFACSCCGSTPSEIYSESKQPLDDEDKHHPLHDGSSLQKHNKMLWLTDCGHVLCKDELPEGGEVRMLGQRLSF